MKNVYSLCKDLESSDDNVKRTALLLLGESLDPRALPAIRRLAAHGHGDTAALARKVLAAITSKKPDAKADGPRLDDLPELSPDEIRKALGADDMRTRMAALKSAATAGDRSLLADVLARAASDENGRPLEPLGEVRALIPPLVVTLGGTFPQLAPFMRDIDARVRGAALPALQSIGDEPSWTLIILSVTDSDWKVNSAAVAALGKLGRLNLIKLCRKMFESKRADQAVKEAVVVALGSSGLPDAVPLLVIALSDPLQLVAQTARKALEQLAAKKCLPACEALEKAGDLGKPPDLSPYRKTMPKLSDETRAALAGSEDADDTLKLLDQLSEEKDVLTIIGMVRRLSRMGNALVVPFLRDLLLHESEEVRLASVEALKKLDTPEATEALHLALEDEAPVVRAKAMLHLGITEMPARAEPEKVPEYAPVPDAPAEPPVVAAPPPAAGRRVDTGPKPAARPVPTPVPAPAVPTPAPAPAAATVPTPVPAPVPAGPSPAAITDTGPDTFSGASTAPRLQDAEQGPPRPPIAIPGFEFQELLGRGGMGAVFKARQVSLGRAVAIKILNPDVTADKRFKKRFDREAMVMSSLTHPNIVSILDRGEIDDRLYIVMEYVKGTTLRQMLAKDGVSPDRAIEITLDLLRGLEHAHGQGIVHRDIKPDNVLIGANNLVKLTDFGIAGLAQEEGDGGGRLTGTNYVLGTLGYMAPEQASSSRVADHRADLYSVGAMLFELLTGDVPMGVMQFPAERGLRVDRRLDAVLKKLLATMPEERYQSATDVLRVLRGLSEDSFIAKPMPVRGDPVPTPIPGPGAPSAGVENPPTPAPRPADRPPPRPDVRSTGRIVAPLPPPPTLIPAPAASPLRWLVPLGLAAIAAAAFFLLPALSGDKAGSPQPPIAVGNPGAMVACGQDDVLVLSGTVERAPTTLLRVTGRVPAPLAKVRLGAVTGAALSHIPGSPEVLIGLLDESSACIVDLFQKGERERVRLPFAPRAVALLDDGSFVACGRDVPAMLVSGVPRKTRPFENPADAVHVPFNQKLVVLAGFSGISVIDRKDAVATAGAPPIKSTGRLRAPGVVALASNSLSTKLYATVPGEAKVLILSLPDLKVLGERKVAGLTGGQPAVNGSRICVPTESGIALLDEDSESVDAVACGDGPKNCLYVGRQLWIARNGAPAVDVFQ